MGWANIGLIHFFGPNYIFLLFCQNSIDNYMKGLITTRMNCVRISELYLSLSGLD